MSASIAISTMASVQANQAAIEASRVHDMQCRLVVKSFDNTTATVVQQQEFASCVQRLNPQPLGGIEILLIKIWIAVVFISMGVGAYKGHRDPWTGWRFGVFTGCIVGFLAPLGLAIIFYAINFLFS